MYFYIIQTSKISALAFVVILLGACPQDPDPEPAEEPVITQFPAIISAIIEKNCVNCHTDDNVGTFSLLPQQNGWENATTRSTAIAATVGNKIMPPFLADNSDQCNNFVNDEFPISSADIAALTNWTDNGAPADTTGLVSMKLPRLATLDRTDAILTMREAYKPVGIGGQDNEDSRCFVIDGLPQSKLLTAFEVEPGNRKNVHHVQLYVTTNSSGKATADEKELADTKSGYACYGDSGVAASNVAIIAVWTPGSGATKYPSGTGIPIPASQSFIMKVHYLVKQSTAPSLDITSIKLKLEEPGAITEAGILTYTNNSTDFLLTKNSPDFIYKNTILTAGLPYDVKIHAIMPHMHDFGTQVTIRLNPGTVAQTCLINIPQWDFEWQRFFDYQTPSIVLKMTDTLEAECHYNTFASPTTITSGESRTNEHCAINLYVVPI